MTIKSEPKSGGAIAKLEEQEEEEEINVAIQATPDVPFATATPASSVAVPAVSFATTSPVPSAAASATVVTASTTGGAATSGKTPSSAVPGQAQVPPNAPPGGEWVRRKVIGPATWTTCTIISVVSCLFCLLPCGLWALLCPCDQKLVYAHHGKAYDEHGRVVGSA